MSRLASAISRVSISKFTASSGTMHLLNLTWPIFEIVSKLVFHLETRSGGRKSSHSNFLTVSSCRSNLNSAIKGVKRPIKSKTSPTRPAQLRRVNLSGKRESNLADFFPLTFFPKFRSLIFKLITSDFGNHFIPATLTDLLSIHKWLGGSNPENVIPFKRNPPLLKTICKSSVIARVISCEPPPLRQSSMYKSPCMISFCLG